ncbi:LicD family protein [Tritonibacter scottomollicae]|uniref:LicD family protein n=2 Tax=Tritonibacter scottomollicae TaxID=483013 RepID=A0A2T1A5I4_TRISK|nr:LicD family protein [Tritonibacter scottomollicae]
MTDPLFSASITPVSQTDISPAPGVFQVQIGYLGLRLSGILNQKAELPPPERISLEADGLSLRKETLRFDKGTAQFRCRVSRPLLVRLAPDTLLEARIDSLGHPLHDARLPAPGGGSGWRLTLPHAIGGMAEEIARYGPVEKKGHLTPDAAMLQERQAGYLELYDALRAVFERDLNRPLFILYGTLLGQVRAQDFIPGDDDFDVGYPSRATRPEAVRREAIEIMCTLAEQGFVIVLNASGRPFRVRSADGPVWCHLDNRPVFTPGDGHVWLHKQARLPLHLADFEDSEEAVLRGRKVLRPLRPEAFLEAYYGPEWRVPDPGYSNTARPVPKMVTRGLSRICLSGREQQELAKRYPGRIIPERWQPLYPLADYAESLGF